MRLSAWIKASTGMPGMTLKRRKMHDPQRWLGLSLLVPGVDYLCRVWDP